MLARPLFAALALLGLAACSDAPPKPMADYDAHQRFQNAVEKREAFATFTPAPDGSLSATDLTALADLAREHDRRGAGPVAISVAYDGNPAAARAFAAEIVSALGATGADEAAVTFAVQPGAAKPAADVSVPVWVAKVPDCGQWPDRINPDFSGQNTANFGCAVTRNIGLMVANPADLERARDASGRSGTRSEDVLTKYGTGKPTSSKVEDVKPTLTLSTVGTGK